MSRQYARLLWDAASFSCPGAVAFGRQAPTASSSSTSWSGLVLGAPARWASSTQPSVGARASALRSRVFSTAAPPPPPPRRSGPQGGPVSFRTLVLSMIVGAGVITGVKAYKDVKLRTILQKNDETVGKAAVGGPFELIDQDGRPFTHKDVEGEFTLLYFGFTYCPDICPDELDKMAAAVDLVQQKTGRKVTPLFISVDPLRDTPSKVKAYVKEFHPRMVGLTGDHDAVQRVCKSYRVFFHKTTDSEDDYLVDHSIIHYLLDPKGDFVTFFGKNYTAEQLADSIAGHVEKWAAEHPGEYQTASSSSSSSSSAKLAALAAPAAAAAGR